jgi:hypothetical protein
MVRYAGQEHHPVNEGLPEPIIILINIPNRSGGGIAEPLTEINIEEPGGSRRKQEVIDRNKTEEKVSGTYAPCSEYPDEYPETGFATPGSALPGRHRLVL